MNSPKLEMKKLDGKTQDLISENVAKLKELFPEAFKEGKVDFDTLRQVLGDEVDNENERYSFTWHGKSDAIKLALKQSTGTLRPCKEESKDWDTTENLFIEGDNLEVLRILQASYRNKIKMIYIDPPYNTGNDFIYTDDFKDNVKHYKEKIGEMGKANPETGGRYHTNWLNMMYPRLRLARNLLKDDGVIFISIDDNEVHNLRKICDEIFGEENVDLLIWNKEAEGKSGTLKQTLRYRVVHEYILIAYKDKHGTLFEKVSEPLKGREEEFQTANLAVNEDKTNESHVNFYTITAPSGVQWTRHWKVSIDEFNLLAEEDLVYWGSKGTSQPRRILPTDDRRTVYATSIIDKGGTTIGRKEYEELMPEGTFSYPKSVVLLIYLLKMLQLKDEIILDFFSGSATTAHAVMSLNAEDSGHRKCISVQIPEFTDEESEAYKAGYKTIADISKERIRRAGEKIKIEHQNKQSDLFAQNASKDLDIGFKVFKLDETNFSQWDEQTTDPEGALLRHVQAIKPNRTQEDALYEVLLKYGVDLSLTIKEL